MNFIQSSKPHHILSVLVFIIFMIPGGLFGALSKELQEAIIDENVEAVAELIKSSDPNDFFENGSTPLQSACISHNPEMIEILLKNGFGNTIKTKASTYSYENYSYSKTPLEIVLNDFYKTKDLYNNIHKKGLKGYIKSEFFPLVEFSPELPEGAIPVNFYPMGYKIEDHKQKINKIYACIKLLLEYDPTIAYETAQMSPHNAPFKCLHFAFLLNSFKLIKLFTESGVDITTLTDDGISPIAFTSNKKSMYLVHEQPNFEFRNSKTTLFHKSATYNNTSSEALEFFTSECGNVDIRDDHGTTPFGCASFYKNSKAIKALLELGADKTTLNDAGRSPLAFLLSDHSKIALKQPVTFESLSQALEAFFEISDHKEFTNIPSYLSVTPQYQALTNRYLDYSVVAEKIPLTPDFFHKLLISKLALYNTRTFTCKTNATKFLKTILQYLHKSPLAKKEQSDTPGIKTLKKDYERDLNIAQNTIGQSLIARENPINTLLHREMGVANPYKRLKL